jgi:hypothetical protein
LGKRHFETFYFLEMYFPSTFFDISVHFTTHLIKAIKLLGPVFLHQMYEYERFNGILTSFIRIERTLMVVWYKDTVQRKLWSGP